MVEYRLQSRCIHGDAVEIKNIELSGATDEEAFAAARERCPFITSSPTYFAGTTYEIQHLQVRTVRVGARFLIDASLDSD